MQACDEAANVMRLHRSEAAIAGQLANQIAQQLEIVPIALERVRRKPPLLGKLVKVGADADGARAGSHLRGIS